MGNVGPAYRPPHRTEILACIEGEAPRFTAGIVLRNDRVVEAADIVGFMKRQRFTRDQVRDHCRKKNWRISIVSWSTIP